MDPNHSKNGMAPLAVGTWTYVSFAAVLSRAVSEKAKTRALTARTLCVKTVVGWCFVRWLPNWLSC